jgi:hypothetical protein
VEWRRRFADRRAVGRFVRGGPSAIHPVASAAVARSSADAIIRVAASTQRRPRTRGGTADTSRAGLDIRCRVGRSGRRAAPAAESAPFPTDLLGVAGAAGSGPTGGSVVARIRRSAASVRVDRRLFSGPAEPTAGAAACRRAAALPKSIADAGTAQSRDAGPQSTEASQVRRDADVAGRRRATVVFGGRRGARAPGSAGWARIGFVPVTVGVGRARHPESSEPARPLGRHIRCSVA